MSVHDDENFSSFAHQQLMVEQQEQLCRNSTTSMIGWCPPIWDGILCWSATAPGETAVQVCPDYVIGFNSQANVTRQCMSDGQWYWNTKYNNTWSNYTQCSTTQFVTVVTDLSGIKPDTGTLIRKYLPIVKSISKVGYSVSLSTLIVAFCILATIKKLRCARNMLHMHLFASFIMRAFMALLKNILFVSGIGLASDILVKDGKTYWLAKEGSNWQCKLFTSFWQYFILANYSWILMEGLYLHNLVFLALFADSNSSITGYVILGWGLPAIFVIPWVVMRIIFENTYCWTTNNNSLLFLIIRLPTVFSILINFVLFINIVRVLLSKLKTTISEETQRYKRWARSTLVLVPLFGVHYTVFLGMSYSIGIDERVELVWLFCDQLFASFQGFFVAVLYCFLNGEVRAEVSRAWRSRKWPRIRNSRWGPRSSTHSISTCSCTATKLGKRSKRPKWWKEKWICFCHDQDTDRSTHSMASTQGVTSVLQKVSDVGTRGCSLASSRGYLEIIGTGPNLSTINQHQNQSTNHTSPLCSKYTDQSLLSFCSNMSEMCTCPVAIAERSKRIREQHQWSDSECCNLAYELHNLQHHTHS